MSKKELKKNKENSEGEPKINIKVDLGMLFAYWLKDNKALDFDSYVERYKNDKVFMNEVNNQKEINEYNEMLKDEKLKEKENE